jgi:hypothetical protein
LKIRENPGIWDIFAKYQIDKGLVQKKLTVLGLTAIDREFSIIVSFLGA